MTKPWLIAGGGISGLSAAIALHQRGLPVRLFESYPQAKPAGAGIIVAPNALEALRRLHPALKERALELGVACGDMRILSERGELLTRLRSGAFGPSAALTRADLYRLLMEALPPETIVFGKRVAAVKQSAAGGPRVTLDDGSEWEGEAVLACDGIHSALRKQLAPPSPLRYTGQTCWRGIAELDTQQPYFSETWGVGSRFGVVPLSQGRVYWYALLNATPGDPKSGAMNAADLLKPFAGFHDPIPRIIQQAQRHPMIHADIADIAPIERFAYGRVLLMGDAAHAMTPNLGQGACQALEDAAILADCLSGASSPQAAFQTFERLRKPRVHAIVTDAYRMGKIAQLDSAALCRVRNFVMRLTPESASSRRLTKLYRMP